MSYDGLIHPSKDCPEQLVALEAPYTESEVVAHLVKTGKAYHMTASDVKELVKTVNALLEQRKEKLNEVTQTRRN